MATTPLVESKEPMSGKSLTRRIVTGAICAVLYPIVAFLPYGHGLPFAIGVTIFSIIGASELYTAVRRQGAEPTVFLGYAACVFFNFSAWKRAGSMSDPYLGLFLVLLLICGLLVELVKKRHHPTANLGTTLLGAIYVGWLSSFITLLRVSAPAFLVPPAPGFESGAWLVVYVSMMTWGADTAALFTGRQFGRHKLAPSISPNKTWEGSFGGVLVSCLIGMGGAQLFRFPLVIGAVLGLLIGSFGLIGDLCASALKRDLGLKDFGDFLPGHGGVLDRIDSLILTAPVAYYSVSIVTHFR